MFGPAPAPSRFVSTRWAGIFDVASRRVRLHELEAMAGETDFWSDNERAQRLLKERAACQAAVEAVDLPRASIAEVLGLLELAEADADPSLLPELQGQLDALTAQLDEADFARTMAAPTDRSPAIVKINAGAGGTDSADWATMLARMYGRWAERHGCTVELLDEVPGEEAGVRSCDLRIEGPFAFGWLKAENGVHRLVRISPFDANKRRQTSFCSVYVLPEEDEEIHIDIKDDDLKVDTFRASGAGGQHVNRTDSAIRITHMPTGIVAACQAERSQHKNRAKAMKMLAARLADLERRKRNAAKDEIEAAKLGINFGSQIRSYVLQPYQMVKDHRTGAQTSDTQGVLDGEIDAFLKAYLLAAQAGPVSLRGDDTD
ncbi:MAG: peptide chain release factor 2 [Myxococcales bacterium]|nr:peptide chain release factor 2 [Myxococcales bacterium]